MTTLVADPLDGLKLIGHKVRWQILQALSRSDFNGNELLARTGASQNLISYHLGKLKRHGLIRESRSIADGREVYYSADLDALGHLLHFAGESLHPALGSGAKDQAHLASRQSPIRVLFLCTQNSARSQMAEGILRDKGGDEVQVFSAGTEPSQIHPLAIEAMDQLNIDIRGQGSKHLDQYLDNQFDYVITVCDRAKESCPIFPGAPEQIHWSFPDPSAAQGSHAERLKGFQNTAIELSQRINFLISSIRRRSN